MQWLTAVCCCLMGLSQINSVYAVDRPMTVSLFAGLETQHDFYTVDQDFMLPQGFNANVSSREDFFWGAGLSLPFKLNGCRLRHRLTFAFSVHESRFYFSDVNVASTLFNIDERQLQAASGIYEGWVQREAVEFAIGWKVRLRRHDWWFKPAMYTQFAHSFHRSEIFMFKSAEPPEHSELVALDSERFEYTQNRLGVELKPEFNDGATWVFGVSGAVGYMVKYDRFALSPVLSLAYSLTDMDGVHADWRRLSPRLFIECSYAINGEFD